MDTGPVIAQRERPIAASDDAATLTEALFADGATLLVATMPGWIDRSIPAVEQDRQSGDVHQQTGTCRRTGGLGIERGNPRETSTGLRALAGIVHALGGEGAQAIESRAMGWL